MDNGLTVANSNTDMALIGKVKEYAADSVAANTKRAYAYDFRQYEAWCRSVDCQSVPSDPQTVAAYFTAMAESGKKASTIDRARAAIRMAHELRGFSDPAADRHVRQVLKGIRRTIGTAKSKKSPTLSNDIKAMVNSLPGGMIGTRNRALLLLGFAGAFRRSELVAITTECIEHTAEGVKILLPKSKTDQEGQGRYVGIKRGAKPDTCPVRALDSWIEAAELTFGPIFRRVNRHGQVLEPMTAQSVALVVKRAARSAGLDPARYSGHSLRAGFVTQGAINGASESNIMRQTGHKSHDTVRGYIRIANIFQDNVSGMLGL